MLTVAAIADYLERFAPSSLAESWDNVGLLVGDRQQKVTRLMTCLSVTPQSVGEAIARHAEMIVAHHPLPFDPLRRLTTETTAGSLLLELISASIAVYSPHTAFDSTAGGINDHLAAGLGLSDIGPLVPTEDDASLGGGRHGKFGEPLPIGELADRLKRLLTIEQLRMVGRETSSVQRVAVACGSGGTFLDAAQQAGCECLVTGETSFHTCLAAEAMGMSLLLAGHYASERFAIEALADRLAQQFGKLEVWASEEEQDPLRRL